MRGRLGLRPATRASVVAQKTTEKVHRKLRRELSLGMTFNDRDGKMERSEENNKDGGLRGQLACHSRARSAQQAMRVIWQKK